MKTKSLAVFALVSLFLVGCVPSLHPLYTENELVFEPLLLGVWAEEGDGVSYEFIKDGSSTYTMIYTEDSIPSDFAAHLLKLGDNLFLKPDEPECGNDFHKGYLISAHSFYKVSLEKDVLCLDGLDIDWLRDLYRDGKTELSREILQGNDFVLTASTKELQKFVLTFRKKGSYFDKNNSMTKIMAGAPSSWVDVVLSHPRRKEPKGDVASIISLP